MLQNGRRTGGKIFSWDGDHFGLTIIKSAEPNSSVILHVAIKFLAGHDDHSDSVIDGDDSTLLEHVLPLAAGQIVHNVRTLRLPSAQAQSIMTHLGSGGSGSTGSQGNIASLWYFIIM